MTMKLNKEQKKNIDKPDQKKEESHGIVNLKEKKKK